MIDEVLQKDANEFLVVSKELSMVLTGILLVTLGQYYLFCCWDCKPIIAISSWTFDKWRTCFGTGAIMNIPNKSGSDIFISDGNQEFETLEKAIPISLKEEEGVNLKKKR